MPLALGDERHSDSPDSAPAAGAEFVTLYERHFDGVYDFVLRITRDRDLAADVVQDSFATAWAELRAGREVKHFKAWMYAIARNRAIDELRRRRRVQLQDATASEEEAPAFAVADPSRRADPATVVEDQEIVDLVWSSAAALKPDEYSLLDMHLRQGLRSGEIADALEVSRGAVHTRLSRLRTALEESVVSTLLIRGGRGDCADLRAIVAEAGGSALTPALRRQVRAHADACEVCQGSRRRIAAPAAIFGALAPIPALPGVRESILQGVMGGHAAGAGAAAAAAHHAGASAHSTVSGKAAATAAALVAAGAAVVVLAASGGASVRDPTRAASTSHAVGAATADRVIRMRWAPGRDADGYSVMFSRQRAAEPPARVNVRGTSFTSAPLPAGRWWFILRTHGTNGHWTDTLRRGPYVIVGVAARRAAPRHAAKRHRHVRGSPALAVPSTRVVRAVASASPHARLRPNAPRRPRRSVKPHHGHTPGPGTGPRGAPAPATPPAAPPPAAQPPTTPPALPNAPADVTPPPVPGGGGTGGNPGGGEGGDGGDRGEGGDDGGRDGGGRGS